MIITDDLYRDYLENLLKGRRMVCYRIVSSLLDEGLELKTLYLDLFQRSLYEVGDLWENNRISVSIEHLATAITESLLPLAYPRLFNVEKNGRRAVIACIPNEYHQIGGKMVADIMELIGWDCYFLGADSPVESLIKLVDDKMPDLVGLSAAVEESIDRLAMVIEALVARFPGLEIIVGGQAFRRGGAGKLAGWSNVEFVPSIEALEEKYARHEPD